MIPIDSVDSLRALWRRRAQYVIPGLLMGCGTQPPAPIAEPSRPDLPVHLVDGAAKPSERVTLPAIVGRLIDDQLLPIGKCGFVFKIMQVSFNDGAGEVHAVATNAEGRFRLELAGPAPTNGSFRLLEITASSDGLVNQSLRGIVARLDITSMFTPGDHDCGDIMVVLPGTDTVLHRLDDQALEAEYAALLAPELEIYSTWNRDYETILTEIARRGGERWSAFLQREFEQRRERYREGHEYHFEPNELVLLTALRRTERKPDPLAITVDVPVLVIATFPHLPEIQVRFKNVDPSETFDLTCGGGFDGSGRFERCRVCALDPKGADVAPLRSTPWSGFGSSFYTPLMPGEALDLGAIPTQHVFDSQKLDLNKYVSLPGPGEYRLRVQYHDEEDIAGRTGVAGLILATSQPFVVRLEPLKVRLSSREVASMKEWIAAIDVEQPVLLTREHWSPTMTFDGEPTSAPDRLFRAGWNALPVLLDALEDEHLATNRRAWIVGLLWDIAGILNPESDRENMISPGNVLFISSWTSEKHWGPGPWRASDGYPDYWIAQLVRFSDRWRAIRSCVELEIVD